MNAPSIRAAQALMRTSALQGHVHAERCVDLDRSTIDLAALDDWAWSSGEKVLVGLLRAFYNGHAGVDLGDLAKLDHDNRGAALLALEIWLRGGEEA